MINDLITTNNLDFMFLIETWLEDNCCATVLTETAPPNFNFISQVKSSHLYLYSAFNNTDCVKALNSIKLEDRVSVMYNNKIKHSISVKGISLLNSEMSLSS